MTNFIGVYDNALAANTCEAIIEAHQQSDDLKEGHTGSGVNKALKDSIDTGMLDKPQWQPFVKEVIEALQNSMRQYFREHPSALTGALKPAIKDPKSHKTTTVSVENSPELEDYYIDQATGALFRYTGFTVQKYDQNKGGYHYFHSEIYPQGDHNEPLHRQVAILLYLNDVEEGGETEFFYQNIKAKPKKGSVIIFPSGFTHTHKGHIPLSDDKYVVTAWLLFNRSEQLFGKFKQETTRA